MHQLLRKELRCESMILDKYYTKESVVKRCIENINMNDYDFIIEPAAGNGSFYNQIKHKNKIGLDIQPEHEHIKEKDWFKYIIDDKYKSVLVIGNPPYGRYHTLSKRFIKYALQFHNVKTIAFILPNVYKKHTRQQIIPRCWRIKKIINLGYNSFTLKNKDFHIDSSFFIIDKSKGKDLRTTCLNHLNEIKDFRFSTKADYDIFVFGASPKKIVTNAKSNNRGYFLKAKIDIDELIAKIKSVDWKGNSCANGGVYWLNKTEFIHQYLSHYKI